MVRSADRYNDLKSRRQEERVVPAYVIANIRVTDEATYEQYKALVPSTVAAFGGRYAARGGRAQVLEGQCEANRMVIIEFPAYEDALAWYRSEAYAPAKALRQAASESAMILVEGAPLA